MSLRPYSTYKDSGVKSLGNVPAHWDVAPIKYHIALRSGGTPSKEVQSYWDGDVPWASSKDLKSELLADTQDHITLHALDAGAAELVPAGSILIVVRGMILAHTFPVAKVTRPMAINQDLKAIMPRERLTADYLAWLLRGLARESLGRADEAAHGTKVLRLADWASMEIPLPTRNEQRAIVAFLDRETAKIDALIAEQQRLMELLQEKRQAVISHAVTKGLKPDAPMKPSGVEWLGDVPAHWDVIRLGRRVVLQRGVDITKDQQNEGTVPVVSSGGISSFHDRSLVSGPGVVIGRKGTAGAMHYIEEDFWPHDTTLYVKEFSGNYPRFVFHLLSSMDLASFDTGSANPTINRNLVHPVFVAWPPKEEQSEIAIAIDTSTQKLDILAMEAKRAVNLLEERRSALITAATTGQIDVRGVIDAEAA